MNTSLPCPLCGSTEREEVLHFGQSSIAKCPACTFLETLPRLTQQELAGLYNNSYYDAEEAKRFKVGGVEKIMAMFRRRKAKEIHARLRERPSRILDIGCGRGDMIAYLQSMGHEVYGTQLSASAAAYARQHFGLQNIFQGDLPEAQYPNEFFDCVSLFHVLEHLPNPVGHLQEIQRIVKPGGFLVIEVPNAGGSTARLTGNKWLAWDVPHHRVHFTPQTLKDIANRTGFAFVSETHSSPEYSPFTLLQSWLNVLFDSDSLLFKRISQLDTRPHLPWGERLSFIGQFIAGAILGIPALLVSVLLSAMGKGDTMRMTFMRK